MVRNVRTVGLKKASNCAMKTSSRNKAISVSVCCVFCAERLHIFLELFDILSPLNPMRPERKFFAVGKGWLGSLRGTIFHRREAWQTSYQTGQKSNGRKEVDSIDCNDYFPGQHWAVPDVVQFPCLVLLGPVPAYGNFDVFCPVEPALYF